MLEIREAHACTGVTNDKTTKRKNFTSHRDDYFSHEFPYASPGIVAKCKNDFHFHVSYLEYNAIRTIIFDNSEHARKVTIWIQTKN